MESMREACVFWWKLILIGQLASVPHCYAESDWTERLIIRLTPELRELDQRLSEIAKEAAVLPLPTWTNSGTRRSFETRWAKSGEALWIELALKEASVADRVVLVPSLGRGATGDMPGFGFPKRFLLEAIDENGDVHVLLDQMGDDFPNPELFPVSIACPSGVLIERVRLTSTGLTHGGERHVLALAELLVLQGNRNLAVEGDAIASSSQTASPSREIINLTDMAMPLGFPVIPREGGRSGWHSKVATGMKEVKSVTVDLGRVFEIGEIRLVPAWPREMPTLLNYGFPKLYFVESAMKKDFSNSRVLVDTSMVDKYPPGQNLISLNWGESSPMRYIRVSATHLRESAGDFVFALAELQAYSGDENVALGAAVLTEESLEDEEWGREALTDGLCYGGKLLELPDWLDGLERRRLLEQEAASLQLRRANLLASGEHLLLVSGIGVPVFISALAALLMWRNRQIRLIEIEQHRERLARDLHDELGSNLGSIALISSFAKEAGNDSEQMRHDLNEIEEVARESADSMRDMVDLLAEKRGGAVDEWLGVMERLAQRVLRDVELDCRLPDGPLVLAPDLESRREIYLFCKEVLFNISQHAGASKVSFHLRSEVSGLSIEITDDGCGFDPDAEKIRDESGRGYGLENLRQRAAGLNGTMNLSSTPGVKTVVTLFVPRGSRWQKPTSSIKA